MEHIVNIRISFEAGKPELSRSALVENISTKADGVAYFVVTSATMVAKEWHPWYAEASNCIPEACIGM